MNEMLIYLIVLIAGLLLGIFFFGGLWWTTHKGMTSKHPALWFLGSIVVRLAVTVLVLYAIGKDHWGRMLLCLAGFIVSRFIVIKLTRVFDLKKSIIKEVNYENKS